MTTTTAHKARNFYWLTVTQTLSLVGSNMTGFAIGVWVFTETGDTTPLLLIPFFYWLPPMLLGAFSGVLVDRMSRKKLIILGDAGQAVVTLLLAFVFVTGRFALWHLYAAALIQALFALLQGPAINASVTMLVPDKQRNRANALLEAAGPAASLLAPSLAGALYAFISVEGILVIDFLTFAIAVPVVLAIHIPQPGPSAAGETGSGSAWQELRDGFQFLTNRRGLLVLILYFTFLNFVTNGPLRLMTPYILLLTKSETTLGLLLTVSSLGLVTGALITIAWPGTQTRIHTIFPSLMWAGAGLMLFGVVRSPWALLVVIFSMQLPYKMNNALLNAIWQNKIPPDMQGRVFALRGQLAIFALPVTYLITGPLIDRLFEPAVGGAGWALVAPLVGSEPGAGIGLYILICGGLLLLATAGVYALPVVRHLERDLPDYAAAPA